MTRLFRLRDAKKFRADGIDANWSHCARKCKRLSSTDWRDDDWPAKTVERAGGNPPDRADHPASLRDRRGRAEGRARKAYPAAYPAWASAPRTETISRRTQITTGKERGRDARGESRIAPCFSHVDLFRRQRDFFRAQHGRNSVTAQSRRRSFKTPSWMVHRAVMQL